MQRISVSSRWILFFTALAMAAAPAVTSAASSNHRVIVFLHPDKVAEGAAEFARRARVGEMALRAELGFPSNVTATIALPPLPQGLSVVAGSPRDRLSGQGPRAA